MNSRKTTERLFPTILLDSDDMHPAENPRTYLSSSTLRALDSSDDEWHWQSRDTTERLLPIYSVDSAPAVHRYQRETNSNKAGAMADAMMTLAEQEYRDRLCYGFLIGVVYGFIFIGISLIVIILN